MKSTLNQFTVILEKMIHNLMKNEIQTCKPSMQVRKHKNTIHPLAKTPSNEEVYTNK